MPRHHILSIIVPCSCCPCAPFEVSRTLLLITAVSRGLCFSLTTSACLMPFPLPCLLVSEDTGSSGDPANCCFSLKKLKPVLAPLPSQSSYSCWPALLCLVGVTRVGNLPDGRRSKGKRRRSSWWWCFADVGFCNTVLIRDANWVRGNSTITDVLLPSTVWVVEAVFADQNALALGGILVQQGVGTFDPMVFNTTHHYYHFSDWMQQSFSIPASLDCTRNCAAVRHLAHDKDKFRFCCNCASCTWSHRQCRFVGPHMSKCSRCIEYCLPCFF